MNIVTIEQQKDHPLETLLDIDSGSTNVEYQMIERQDPIQLHTYDDKDMEIENKLEDIYVMAINQATLIGDEMERVEGRHKARIGEVTATMLNVALGAVREKSVLKAHKDKLTPVAGATGAGGTVTNNNILVADRNEIMRMILAQTNTNS